MYISLERLVLRSLDLNSLDALTDLLTDETVKQTYMVPDYPSREAAAGLGERLIALSQQEDRLMAGIYFGDALVGILNETEREGERIELGYAVLPRYQNQGFASEALRGAIGYCFQWGFREVTAGAFQENAASIRVMTKCGMNKQNRTDQIDYRGKTHTCVYYSISPEGEEGNDAV